MYTNVNSGSQTVTAGTATKLVSDSQPSDRVDIQASITNTGIVYVGGPLVSASSKKGVALYPGDVYNIEKMADLITIYIDGTVSGDTVGFNYWIGEVV